jgi:diguanylate cyclase (GGDEF)-like protein/PAS domain S-box-containing protein
MRFRLGPWLLLVPGCLLAAGAGLWLADSGQEVAPPWVFDGLLLGVLLETAPRRRPLALAAAFLGAALGWLVGHGPPAPAPALATCSLIFQLSALALLDRMGWRPADLATPRGLGRAAAAALLVAPALPAVLAAAAGLPGHGGGFLGNLWHWSLGEVLGLAIVVPVVITLARRDLLLLLVPPQLAPTFGLLVLYAAVLAAAFLQNRLPLAFAIYPALLLLVRRLGLPGAGLGILATAGVAIAGIALRVGPFGVIPDATPFGNVLFAQMLIVAGAALVFPEAAAVAERRRLAQALTDQHARVSRSQHLYRLLAENASDIITRVRLDGQRLYVSPSVTHVLGWTVKDMLRPDWQELVHPDDLPDFLAAREQIRRGEEYIANTYRHRRRDGSWCWIEARIHLVRTADGTPREFIANLRDITRQKEAEQALEAALAELAEQAATDELTGLANRRRFDAVLDQAWRRTLRAGEPLSVLMIDADQFKAFNDRYGHIAGDDCLRRLARAIAGQLHRPHDLVARYGGEEFAAILPATAEPAAARLAERIRAAVEALELPHEGSAGGIVTISVGVAGARAGDIGGGAALVDAADRALYAAKRGGRNRTIRAGDSEDTVSPSAHRRRAALLATEAAPA